MKILTVIGARPQFIKAAVVSKALRERPGLNEFLVHTGQHFDLNMSGIFFEQMGISKPDANLGISGGSHAEMTGEMLVQIEHLIIQTNFYECYTRWYWGDHCQYRLRLLIV